MKKNLKLCLLWLAVLTLLTLPALAETDLSRYRATNGNVTAVRFVDITAPCSGTLESFDLEAGDRVTAGDTLFTLMTTTIYAPEDGTVSAVFAAAGDDAADIMSRYGCVIAIDPAQLLRISATTNGAYNDDDNLELHIGETLYFQSAKGDKEEGFGRVISVSGKSYVVDIDPASGEMELNESLTLYRSDDYLNKENVGKGTVAKRDPVTVSAAGRVAEVLVSAGQEVHRGDALMTVLSSDADPDARPAVTAPSDGVLASVAVSAGQSVWKGQVLARLYLTDALEIVADVDEMDLGTLSVGAQVPVTLDMDEETVYTATVTEISALGVTRQNAAYYTVHFSLKDNELPLGASASVYLPR